ncbi:MAG: ABC transporter ATP-binding protein [Thermodesulfobacteriota bacterium]
MLRITDLEVHYDHIQALHGVSIHVPEAKIIALLGANGAGKTTTINTISGLMRPTRGTIQFNGARIDRLEPDRIVRLGISQVPESREIFPLLSIKENLELGAYTRKDKKQIAEDMDRILELFPNLGRRISQKAMTLSGGEQQMLLIGRALMSSPKLLLLDEPSLGLSPLLVQEIFRVINVINQLGTTILLVEQNARIALSISSYAYILGNGAITMEGRPEELVGNEEVKKSYLGG